MGSVNSFITALLGTISTPCLCGPIQPCSLHCIQCPEGTWLLPGLNCLVSSCECWPPPQSFPHSIWTGIAGESSGAGNAAEAC